MKYIILCFLFSLFLSFSQCGECGGGGLTNNCSGKQGTRNVIIFLDFDYINNQIGMNGRNCIAPVPGCNPAYSNGTESLEQQSSTQYQGQYYLEIVVSPSSSECFKGKTYVFKNANPSLKYTITVPDNETVKATVNFYECCSFCQYYDGLHASRALFTREVSIAGGDVATIVPAKVELDPTQYGCQ